MPLQPRPFCPSFLPTLPTLPHPAAAALRRPYIGDSCPLPPDVLSRLGMLEELDLSGALHMCLPPELLELQHLTRLGLSEVAWSGVVSAGAGVACRARWRWVPRGCAGLQRQQLPPHTQLQVLAPARAVC